MKSTGILTTARMALLLASCSLAALPVANAYASNDPLEQPALKAVKAASALLVTVTSAGTRLVAAGEHGIIVYSDDQGKSWRQADVPVSVTLTSLQFLDAQHGWAVGHDGVALSTTDGGQSWTKRFDGNQANTLMLADLKKVADDAHHALDAAAATPATAKKAAQDAVDAADNAVGDVEAGAKFGPSRPLLGVFFKNPNEGYMVGSYGQIFHTTNGGNAWESLAGRMHNPEGLHYNAITAGANGTILIAGEGGKVYRSSDNGQTWQTLDTGYKGQLYGVLDIGDALLTYGFGGHIFLGTADAKAGKDAVAWQELPAITRKSLVGATQLADGSLLLAAQDGSLLKSSDHGHSFSLAQPGSGLEIAAVAAAGSQVALAGVGGIHLQAQVK